MGDGISDTRPPDYISTLIRNGDAIASWRPEGNVSEAAINSLSYLYLIANFGDSIRLKLLDAGGKRNRFQDFLAGYGHRPTPIGTTWTFPIISNENGTLIVDTDLVTRTEAKETEQ